MYEVNQLEAALTVGGTQGPSDSIELTSSQLQYLAVLIAQSTVTLAAGTPAGTVAKAGVIGLNVLATASAQIFSNYFFSDIKN